MNLSGYLISGIIGCGICYYTYSYLNNKIRLYIANRVINRLKGNMDDEGVTFQQFKKSSSAMVIFAITTCPRFHKVFNSKIATP